MKILFYPEDCAPFHGNTLEEKPIGGVETAVIRLARALSDLGHDVAVLTQERSPPLTQPRYVEAEQKESVGPVDLLIAVRSWRVFGEGLPAKKRLLWTGDASTNLHTLGLGDPRVYGLFDGLLCVSRWQAEGLIRSSGIPRKKVHLLRNGVDLREFTGPEKRLKRRLIYTSNPQRGLAYLPITFIRLKQKYPDLELHIFSNAALYDMQWPPVVSLDLPHHALLKLLRGLPGCFVHGTVLQKQLAREFLQSTLLAYPASIPETSCMSVMEAQAAGCPTVTTHLGGLPETVGEAGIIVNEIPGTDIFFDTYTAAVDRLLTDDSLWATLSQKALEQSRLCDWHVRAEELLRLHESI